MADHLEGLIQQGQEHRWHRDDRGDQHRPGQPVLPTLLNLGGPIPGGSSGRGLPELFHCLGSTSCSLGVAASRCGIVGFISLG